MRVRARKAIFVGALACLVAPAVHAQVVTGTYTGDGTVSNAITGLGFQPDIVIIKVDEPNTNGIIRTSTMAAGSRQIWNGSALAGNLINSLDANGFTVGSDIRVNGSNACGAGSDPCNYYWTAFKVGTNIQVGTYSGDGAATQAITGIGFGVDFVMIFADAVKWPRNRWSFASTTPLGAGANFRIRNAGENSVSIPSLDANGFTVGDGNGDQEDANDSGVTYHYIAFNQAAGEITMGMYTGDGMNPRDVTSAGFQPIYVIVQSLDDGDQAFQKSDKMPAATSSDFLQGQITNRIVGLLANGFQVSNDARVNSSGEDYTYIAFSGAGSSPVLDQGHYRWRNDDGPEGSGSAPLQATSTLDDTTTSTTDVVLAAMTITPGAGNYIAWFSGSLENTTGTDDQFVSIYLDGTQVAHTERQATTESSITDTPFPVATHAFLPGVTAGQSIDVRWRTTAGTATMHERTLVVARVTPADVIQATSIADDTTTSGSDVLVAGMTVTAGAGDYLVWFSGSVEGNTAATNQFVSIYQNGVKVNHSERQSFTEGSIPDTSFPVATHAFLAGVGAGQPIAVRWRTEGGTATMHERTLVVAKVNAADIFQASATVDTVTASGTDVVVPSLTLTPGAGDYLAWFSSSIEADTTSTSQFASLYDNGAKLAHSERRIFTEGSIADTSFPIASHAYIPGLGAAEAVDVRFRTTGGNATMHERTLVLAKLSSTAGATWAEAEDTKLIGLTKTTPRRVRFGIANSGGVSSGAITYELQVAETGTCSAGAYAIVPTASTGHWQIVGSTFITDGEATNDISPGLTDDATTFVAGELKDAGNTTGSVTLAGDAFTEIEFAVQATTNATDGGDYCFRLYDATNNKVLDTYNNYAEVQVAASAGTLTLADHDAGQVSDKFTSAASVTDVLFRFKLIRTPSVTITDIRAHYTTGSGVVNADVTAGALYRDNNNDGVVDGGDSLLKSGIAGSGGQLAFTALSEDPGLGTNYLVVATVNNLVPGDTTTFSLGAADIDEVEVGVVEAGAVTNAVHTANAAAPVYYSVGTSVADFKNGTPTVTISSGTATFTTPQPANVGVGDEITYNGGTIAYISGRTSAFIYAVTTATGTTPLDIAGATVNSITRAFNTLKVAATDSLDASHLNTFDLVAGDIQLNLACYDDGADPSMYVRIEEPWITGPTTYIRVFTPVSTSEVGISQRHFGVAGTGYRIAPTGPASNNFFNFILVSTDFGYVRVEGVEIDGSGLTFGENVRGMMANDPDPGGTSEDVRFTHNLIHDITNSTIDDTDTSRVLGIYLDDTDNSKVANNIIYNLTSVSAALNSAARGIEADDAGKTHHVYNNTLYNIRVTVGPENARGIYDDGGNTVFARNNFVGLVENLVAGEIGFGGPFAAENNNVSSDATAVGAGSRNNQSSYASYFASVTPGSENFHLLADSNTLWTTVGADLDTDPVLPVTDDIDGEPRHPSTPDIGADEATVTTNYRSLGTASAYSTGTIDVTAGSPVVTGTTTAWLTANRGRGDHIAFNLEEYTVLSVDSETQLTLTGPVASTFTGGYTISRQFTTIRSWEQCISGGGGCTFFAPASSNLVADDRREVGIAYDDSVVPADPDFTDGVRFEGATTDATHTITLTADGDNRHYGIRGAGVLVDCNTCLDADDEIFIDDDNVTIEWLEVSNHRGNTNDGGINVRSAFNVVLQYLLVHDNWNGIRLSGTAGKSATIRNSIVYDNIDRGIEGDEVGDVMVVENCTVFGNGQTGVDGDSSVATTTVRNTISMNNTGPDFRDFAILENSISEDGTASCGTCLANRDFTDLVAPGAPPQGNGWVMFLNLTALSEDFHLRDNVALNDAQDNAQDLSASFTRDIDFGVRMVAWDVGADDAEAATAVELISFEAEGLESAVELSWETGSEIDNLGFHLYRSTTADGEYERITRQVIPGLGSSPAGARYRYRDDGLTNDVTYYYQLEDIDTSGATELHGPISVVPRVGASPVALDEDASGGGDSSARSLVTFGDPSANRFEVLSWDESGAVVELRTEGFFAEPAEDGSVIITAPGLELLGGGDALAISVARPWIDIVAGVGVKVVGIETSGVEIFSSLRPLDPKSFDLVATSDGVVRAERRRRWSRRRGLTPRRAARVHGTEFRGETKQAQLELAPLRWNAKRSELRLTRRLTVRLAFTGRAKDELVGRGRYRPRRFQDVIARFATTSPGLHVVHYHQIFGASRRAYDVDALRLSRLGRSVPVHVEPDPRRMAPRSKLYFLSAGPEANPYGHEAVYELEWSDSGATMTMASASPAGEPAPYYWKTLVQERDQYYQASLLRAPDRWLWDVLLSRDVKTYTVEPVDLDTLASSVESGRLSVWLQGASDLDATPDHHVRVSINGMVLGQASWDGKNPYRIDVELPPGALVSGTNTVAIENVGDTDAAFSAFFLDRFELTYPRLLAAEAGQLEGAFRTAGTATVAGLDAGARILDVTDANAPVWLGNPNQSAAGELTFRVEANRDYLAVSPASIRNPTVKRAARPTLRRARRGADYLLIGPQAFLEAAEPLARLRRSQGLRVQVVAFEQIRDEFGYGEPRPEAIRDFLKYAYHEWRMPRPRYVVLLGDGTYDYKDWMGMGVDNQLPPLMVETSFLWTASDPTLAMIDGDDMLPDVAIGRLPAKNVDELRVMVAKILAFENGDASFHTNPLVLVADNPDRAGDFVANADEIAASVLPSERVEKIYLSELGTTATRAEIVRSFDDGASLVSYIGHGGIHLWANENIFNTADVETLAAQSQQPFFVTMNCLNGFFHFPFFDSLAEGLVKAEGRGAIAAFSPTGLSLNTPAHRFHKALLAALVNQQHERLGDAVLAAQQSYAESGAFPELLAIYHLFGDPALRLK